MPTEILMPALSPTMEEGTLAKWLVKEGDTVSSGDLLAEIETDKATMEFEAVDEGTIGKILVSEGSEGVKVNTPIAVLLAEGESADDIGTSPAPKSEPAEAKAEESPALSSAASAPAAAQSAPPAPSKDGERIFASPLARRIAADKGLDLAAIKGSGPRGRIVKADVEGATAKAPAEAAKPQAAAPAAAPAAGPSADAVAKMYEGRDYQEIKLDGMRKTLAARLTEAKQQIPHFYLRRDIRLDALLKFRGQLNKQLESRGVKLSVNDFVIKACALALQQVPTANAVWAGDRILQ
ncbi:2-oxo acid dehydrogenase subunit E2, partial [Pseudooceanicola sp.]|uniref:2-oxo acid dehydrogenase subunit E2 n=1 Tax=Pseudooceanicola sp. TaxID=1914328 RepID=UPI0035124733